MSTIMNISSVTGKAGISLPPSDPVTKRQKKISFPAAVLQEMQQEGGSGRTAADHPAGLHGFGQSRWKMILQDYGYHPDRTDDAADRSELIKNAAEISDWLLTEPLVAERTSCTFSLEGDQYDQVMSFLNGLEDKENQPFTIHTTFWKDFLSGKLDMDEFTQFLDTKWKDGGADCFKITEDGTCVDRDAMKFSVYMYGPQYGTVMARTTEEFLEWQEMLIQKRNGGLTDKKILLEESVQKQGKVLGIGFLNAPTGRISYGMRAEYADASTSDSPVIKVTIQKIGSEETYYVDINHVDAGNATEIEMFALCCYADDTGRGTGGKFGTWQTLNCYRTNAVDNGMFHLTKSMDSCLSLRQNWRLMIDEMRSLYIKSGLYQQSLEGNLLLKMLGKCEKYF